MQDVFSVKDAQDYIDRIQRLTPESKGLWGTMTVSQMLAHCNVTYALALEPEKFPKPSFIAKFLLKRFVKPKVTNDKPYRQNLPTSPMFVVKEEKDFEEEKKKLIGNIQRVQQLGKEAFDGRVYINFGVLKAQEWNNMFAKHLNHHLAQFGV